MFEDIGQRGDKIVLAACVEFGKRYLRHGFELSG
jgi:hypothetical protein